jgi:hypothetical protein
MRSAVLIAAVASSLTMAGCFPTSTETPRPRPQPAAFAARPAAIPVEALVGKWGVASYREEKDRKRTERMARLHCRQPYVISKGPTDGVMMHVADDAKKYELTTKAGPNGKTYLGFNAPPGHDQDREIVTYSKDVFTAKFVNPEINTRYGIYIYVRCPA